MKPLASKQLRRVEKKRRKLAAYLEIAKLNDKDREAKTEIYQNREDYKCSGDDDNTFETMPQEEYSRKRHKKNNETTVGEGDRYVSDVPVESSEPQYDAEPVLSCKNNFPPGFSDHAMRGKSGKIQLIGEEYAQLKLELQERKKHLKYIPRFRLKGMGNCASLTVKEEERTPLFMSDVQHLLMYSMLGHHSPYQPSRWCQLEKYNHVSHRVVLLIEGLSLYDFQAHESQFPTIRDIFKDSVEVITPPVYNGSLVEELAAVPLTGTQKHRLLNQFGSLEAAMKNKEDLFKVMRAIFPVTDSSWTSQHAPRPNSDQYSRTQLLLSASQLIEENYPLPLKGELRARYKEFVLTKDLYQEVTHSSPMFGLDCEMCRTTSGELEVTRVSVVNEQLEVVYETFVKPYNRITDYLTRFSGITKELLADVDVRLENVQKDIRALLPPDAILVGQSLNFDLVALKMMHPYVIDTSVIYNITGDRFRKAKLALLAQKFLGEEIQKDKQGHCSVEDSSTCMKLTQLKLANDIHYGDAILAGHRGAMGSQRQVQPMSTQQEVATSLFSHVTKLDKSAAIVGCKEVVDKYSDYMSEAMFSISKNTESSNKLVQCIVTPNDMVVSQTCDIAREHSFVLAHVQVEHGNSEVIRHVNGWCKSVWEHMAYKGLCVILFSGQKSGANGACFIEIKRPPLPSQT